MAEPALIRAGLPNDRVALHLKPMPDTLSRLTSALADRYTIEHEVGAGGMAIVYLATDRKLDRQVAIKVLRPELAAAMGIDRFVREVELTSQLEHPNILSIPMRRRRS